MLTHNTITCCYEGCLAVITLHPDDEAKLRRTHEWFYCPVGHEQHFTGKTKEQKLIESLKVDLEAAQARSEAAFEDEYAERLRGRRIARAVQTCPLGCGWQGNRRLDYYDKGHDGKFLDRVGQDLADHLAQKHDVKVKILDGRLVAPEVVEESANA